MGKEHSSGYKSAVERMYTQPHLDKPSQSQQAERNKIPQIVERLSEKRTLITATAAVSTMPFFAALADGMDYKEAAMYAALEWYSLGNYEDPHLSALTSDTVDSGIQIALNSVGFGAIAKLGYEYSKRMERKGEEIKEGTAEIKPNGEQVIILGGRSSNILNALASSTEKNNIVPILDSSAGASEIHYQYASRVKERQPYYLNLEVGTNGHNKNQISYLDTHAWDKLLLSRENVLNSSNGHRYLLVVGCGQSAGKELSLDPQNIDLSHDDLRSALLQLNKRLKPDVLVENRDIIDMYIGNANILRTNAENRQVISDRDLAKKVGVDIYVDTWAFVLRELAEKIAEGKSREVAIATTNTDYAERFNEMFAEHLTNIQECEGLQFVNIDEASEDAVWIVYEQQSDETLFTAKRLRKWYPQRRIIALMANHNIENYVETSGVENVEFIYASTVMAKTIVGVRDLIKGGFSPKEIQEMLDEYAPRIEDKNNILSKYLNGKES